jgi:ROK family protein
MMKRNNVIGIDIGGSHISVCVVDLQHSCLLDHSFVRAKVNPGGNASEIIDEWAMAIKSSYKKLAEGSGDREKDWYIGIAMPGPFDYDKGISLIKGLHKFESLYGLPVKQMLADRLSIPAEHIRMVNDASAFLLGEVKGGAGKGYTRVAGVTLGTGVGSAGFFNDMIEDGDLWCMPFRDSRAEDYLCSRWFVQEYAGIQERRWGQGAAISNDGTGGNPMAGGEDGMRRAQIHGVKDLVPLFDIDPEVRQLFTRFGQHLAEALLLKYPSDRQDVLVVGGNITRAWDLFIPAVMAWWEERGVVMNIRPALLGEHAAVFGGAFLWR